MFNLIINPLAIALSISTSCGIFVHDMKIDKFTVAALSLPAVVAAYDSSARTVHFTTDLHPHTERASLAQAVNDLKGQTPRVQPRGSDDKKHLTQKYAPRGHHTFDTYNLPLA